MTDPKAQSEKRMENAGDEQEYRGCFEESEAHSGRRALAASTADSVPWHGRQCRNSPSVHVNQVISDTEVIAEHGEFGFWLTGINAKNIVDGKEYDYGKNGDCKGTKNYMTGMGSMRTVFLVEPIDMKQFVKAVYDLGTFVDVEDKQVNSRPTQALNNNVSILRSLDHFVRSFFAAFWENQYQGKRVEIKGMFLRTPTIHWSCRFLSLRQGGYAAKCHRL